MDGIMDAIKNFLVEFWGIILFFTYQFTLIGGTLMMGIYVAIREEKILSGIVKMLIFWLILEGIDVCI
ncbi:MAG: hypothetical protein RSF40_01720 [Oscillospiraceae bacterium]